MNISGEQVRNQLVYFPTVTRAIPLSRAGVTELIESGKLFQDTACRRSIPHMTES